MIKPSLLNFVDSEQVGNLCRSFLKNKIEYACVTVIESNKMYNSFSDIKWQEVYRNCNLHYHDPLFLAALSVSDTPIFWDSVPVMTKKAAGIMQERKNFTGVSSGVIISFFRGSKKMIISLGANLTNVEFIREIKENFLNNLDVEELFQRIN